jgi:hypothetical protein
LGLLPKPETVGLAISGGGHRATIFALGALLYIVDTGVNRYIRTISSVSGGSILNGYLGLLDKPFHQITAHDFEQAASRIASEIAGKPRLWKYSLALGSCSILVWACGVLLDFSYLIFISIFGAILVSIFGARCGGTLWAWSGTWIYVVICVGLFFFLLVSFLHVPFAHGATLWPLCKVSLISLVFAYLISIRNDVASLAFGMTVCKLAKSANATLESLHTGIEHVICATEMHGGQHFYFTRDFVYSPGIGVGRPRNFPVRAAIQASANYPGAFPFRKLRTSRFQFRVWDMKEVRGGPRPALYSGRVGDMDSIENIPKSLVLADGGVFDNLGVSWFLKGKENGTSIQNWVDQMLTGLPAVANTIYEPRFFDSMKLGDYASGIMYSIPHTLIVVNAGKPARWRGRYGSWLPIVSDLAGLRATTDIMYYNTQGERIRDLQLLFAKGEAIGAVVDMAEIGVEQRSHDCIGAVDQRRDAFLEGLPWPRRVISELRSMVETNGLVPTTLLPLGRDRTANLLYHGYLQAMISLHIRLDYPLLEMPERARFLKLIRAST